MSPLDTFTVAIVKTNFHCLFPTALLTPGLKYKAIVYVWTRCRCSISYEGEREIFEIFAFHNERRTMSPTKLHVIGHLQKEKVNVG